VEAHEHGIVTSARLMVRWPAAVKVAAYARRRRDLTVALHIDLGLMGMPGRRVAPPLHGRAARQARRHQGRDRPPAPPLPRADAAGSHRPRFPPTRAPPENWRVSLNWQRLPPFDRFAAMIERHWPGIAAYCQPENKVVFGFVEGLYNTIRVLQQRAHGLRDDEYLRLRILTTILPDPPGIQIRRQ
jgi:hypothetical protein